jgi:hypothetical protein
VIVDATGPDFMMGSPVTEADRYDIEAQHRRHIGRRFAIATTEVTKEQYRECRKARPNLTYSETTQWSKTGNAPEVGISWYEAAAYCDWLSEVEGIPREQWCYERNDRGEYDVGMKAKDNHLQLIGYRLPTEAEWEYACRAKTTTSRYFGATEALLPQYAWYLANGQNQTWPARTLRPNDFGIFDMLGNVMEWCFDRYVKYPRQADRVFEDVPTTQPAESEEGRVQRGGSFNAPAGFVRSATRNNSHPGDHRSFFGFRPARTYP